MRASLRQLGYEWREEMKRIYAIAAVGVLTACLASWALARGQTDPGKTPPEPEAKALAEPAPGGHTLAPGAAPAPGATAPAALPSGTTPPVGTLPPPPGGASLPDAPAASAGA